MRCSNRAQPSWLQRFARRSERARVSVGELGDLSRLGVENLKTRSPWKGGGKGERRRRMECDDGSEEQNKTRLDGE